MGALTANQGADNVNIVSTSSGTSACTVTFASLAGITAANGGVLNFSSSTAFGTTGNELLFTTNPALTNGILPRVVVTNTTLGTLDFATTSATGIQGYTASGGTSQLVLSNAAAADNVKLTASISSARRSPRRSTPSCSTATASTSALRSRASRLPPAPAISW